MFPYLAGDTLASLLAGMAGLYSVTGPGDAIEPGSGQEKYYAGQLAGGAWHR